MLKRFFLKSLDSSGRRLSYKEDDLLRKQRLKENLNQLLIEYKHEEEANMKKLSKFASTSNTTSAATNITKNNRASLDTTSSSSGKPATTTTTITTTKAKSSAFSLLNPAQPSSCNAHSAFRPVTGPTTSSAITKSNKNTPNQNSSSSSWSSTCSSASSSSSSSSSKSPPKSRTPVTQTATPKVDPTASDYKKPCLISPRKPEPSLTASESKSLTIAVSQQPQPLQPPKQQSSPIVAKSDTVASGTLVANLSGYLSKSRDGESTSYEKYWFSLNTTLCTLMFWSDKYEQDLGKLPLGKYELSKCCQVTKDLAQAQQQSYSYHNHYFTSQAKSFDFKLAVSRFLC